MIEFEKKEKETFFFPNVYKIQGATVHVLSNNFITFFVNKIVFLLSKLTLEDTEYNVYTYTYIQYTVYTV